MIKIKNVELEVIKATELKAGDKFRTTAPFDGDKRYYTFVSHDACECFEKDGCGADGTTHAFINPPYSSAKVGVTFGKDETVYRKIIKTCIKTT